MRSKDPAERHDFWPRLFWLFFYPFPSLLKEVEKKKRRMKSKNPDRKSCLSARSGLRSSRQQIFMTQIIHEFIEKEVFYYFFYYFLYLDLLITIFTKSSRICIWLWMRISYNLITLRIHILDIIYQIRRFWDLPFIWHYWLLPKCLEYRKFYLCTFEWNRREFSAFINKNM